MLRNDPRICVGCKLAYGLELVMVVWFLGIVVPSSLMYCDDKLFFHRIYHVIWMPYFLIFKKKKTFIFNISMCLYVLLTIYNFSAFKEIKSYPTLELLGFQMYKQFIVDDFTKQLLYNFSLIPLFLVFYHISYYMFTFLTMTNMFFPFMFIVFSFLSIP